MRKIWDYSMNNLKKEAWIGLNLNLGKNIFGACRCTILKFIMPSLSISLPIWMRCLLSTSSSHLLGYSIIRSFNTSHISSFQTWKKRKRQRKSSLRTLSYPWSLTKSTSTLSFKSQTLAECLWRLLWSITMKLLEPTSFLFPNTESSSRYCWKEDTNRWPTFWSCWLQTRRKPCLNCWEVILQEQLSDRNREDSCGSNFLKKSR